MERENTRITFINNSYTLKSVGDSQFSEGEIVTQVIYEENSSSDKFKNPLIYRGRKSSQIILNVSDGDTSTTQIFLLKLIESCESISVGKLSNVVYT